MLNEATSQCVRSMYSSADSVKIVGCALNFTSGKQIISPAIRDGGRFFRKPIKFPSISAPQGGGMGG